MTNELLKLAEDYARHLVAVDFWSGKVTASAVLAPAYEAKGRLEAFAAALASQAAEPASDVLGYLAFQGDECVFFKTMQALKVGTARWYPKVSRIVPVVEPRTPPAPPAGISPAPLAGTSDGWEVIGWEYRWLDTANKPNRWSAWERCRARNIHMNTDKDFADEIQAYIDMGNPYELRTLYIRVSGEGEGA